MKSFINGSFVIFAFTFLAAITPAQQASNPPFDFPAHINVPGEKSDETRYREMVRRNNERSPRGGPSPEPRVLKSGLLAPSEEDRANYGGFLGQRETGLVRLLPHEIADMRTSPTQERFKTNGRGAYYSFSYLSHEYGYGSDIELDHNNISAGGFAGADYGMLTMLGDVSLDEIGRDDPRLTFMATYKPPPEEPRARCEYSRFRNGANDGGFLYKKSLPVQVNSTYLLRSINYGISDVLVAFRIVRQDTDGSVIIVWKLMKYYTPIRLGKVLYVNNSNKCPTR